MKMSDSSSERPSLFDFSHIDSLSYPSSYETTIPSSLSLFNLDSSERSSITDYAFVPIPAFSHPHQIRIPQTPSASCPQDEGYVTPDFEAEEPTEEPTPTLTNLAKDPGPIRSWEALIGCRDPEKPFLSSYGDADTVEKMMWLAKGDKTQWFPNDPVVIQISDFVHDLKYLLAGIPSRSFELNSDSNTFSVTPNIKLPAISSECLCAFAEEFITCGNASKFLDRLSSNSTKRCYGLVYNTLCQTLSIYLQCVRSMILHLNLPSKSLPAVSYVTSSIRSQLIAMSRICHGFDADPPSTGGNIIDRLFTELESMATSDDATLVYSVLQPCLSVYFKFLFRWIFKGEIDDPNQEFFIEKKFPHIISNSRTFWLRGFVCVNKLLPSFLSDLKDDILACGKTMCLLRTCDPNNPIFRLIDDSSIAMDVCDSYNSLEELRQAMNAYYLQCQNKLGTRVGFKIRQRGKSETLLQEEARQARERNMAEYQAKRRKKLQEIADKKYKQLLELKQQISDLKLQKEEEEKLRLEAEKEWLEQIKKEQEFDMILEQTKQAKIGEFYKTLLEESQKRVALTVWKIKRSKLTEKRINYFREAEESNTITGESSGSCPKTEEIPTTEADSASAEQEITAAQNAETNELVRSFIEQLDSKDTDHESTSLTEEVPKTAETNIEISLNVKEDNLNLAETSPEFSQNNLNFRAWLDDKDQALRNRVKVLSSGLGDVWADADITKKSVEKRVMSSCDNTGLDCENLTKKCDIIAGSSSDKPSTAEKDITSECDINKPCVNSNIDKPSVPQISSDSNKTLSAGSEITKSDSASKSITDQPNSSKSDIDESPSPKNDTEKSPSAKSNIDKSPTSKCDINSSNTSKSQADESPSSKSDINSSNTSKSQTDKHDISTQDIDRPLSELEDERFLNLNNLPLKTDIIDAIFPNVTPIHATQTSSPDLTMISSLCVESVRIPLRVHTLVANYSLMKHFVDAQLIAHFHLVRNHFLLHDASFRTTFVRGLGRGLREYRGLDARQVDWNSVLVEGLSRTNVEEVDPAMFLVLGVENAPEVLDITNPEVFDCFSLQYSVEWPLNLIITPDAISRYNKIFKFLLKVMYIDWILMKEFKVLKDKKKKHGFQYKQICLFRHSMIQFIHPLTCFISESIVQAEFDHLLAELEKDCHIDSVYYKHAEYVKSLMFNCFLTSKSERIASAFTLLFKNILQFNEALVQGTWKLDRRTEQLVHSNYNRLELYFGNFIQMAGDIRDFLLKLTDQGYQYKLNNFTAQLSLNFRS